jgi:hypothetical protein
MEFSARKSAIVSSRFLTNFHARLHAPLYPRGILCITIAQARNLFPGLILHTNFALGSNEYQLFGKDIGGLGGITGCAPGLKEQAPGSPDILPFHYIIKPQSLLRPFFKDFQWVSYSGGRPR